MFLSSQGLWYGESEFQSPGQYLHSCLFFFCVFLCRGFFFSLPLSPGSNPHFSNEYKYLFCGCVSWRHIGCFSTIKVFVGAAGCNAATLERADASALSPLLSHSLIHTHGPKDRGQYLIKRVLAFIYCTLSTSRAKLMHLVAKSAHDLTHRVWGFMWYA